MLAALVIVFLSASLVRNADFRSEIKLWQAAVSGSPGKQRPHQNYGVALAQASRHADALRAFDDTLALPPDGSVLLHYLHIERGNAHYHLGELDLALASWKTALMTSPGNAEVLTNMATVFLEQGRIEDAEAYARFALRVPDPFAETLEVMGEIELKRKRYREATSYLTAALQKKPDLLSAYLTAARAREGAGEYREAYRIVQQYLAKDLKEGDRQEAQAIAKRLHGKIQR